ncbi:mucin-5AC-like isoform X1 [Synchiropus splendidus]|uniref:mucin-5AC-like isoform X1 n=1 Tax=Synchiropus splendidus TaxID=270530 RepID=UPI00237D5A95|nr:mucin-5AC-like isoform X1 [Synchiropus splendidus]XP_053715502.1 mucin-5AC-like isoform X1 [Synchiropus splendidus]
MYGLRRRPPWRWSPCLLSIICVWLLMSPPPTAVGYFLGDTKAVLNGCNDHWTLQDRASMPLLYHMTVCVDVRVVIPGPWVAFSYSSVHAPKPELGLEGDSQALYGWLLRVRHRFPVSLSPFQWHRVCLKRDVRGNTFSLQVDEVLVAKRTVIAQAIPPSGSLWLGCRPRDKVRGAVRGKVEVYMFRMWPDLNDHGLCEDGSVIRWNANYWGLTSPRARETDPQLMCDHRRLKRDVRAKRSATAFPTGFRRLFSPPPMPHTTTTTGPVMRALGAASTASSRTIPSSLPTTALTRSTNTARRLDSVPTPLRTTSLASTLSSRALISATPAFTASSSDVSTYSPASQTAAAAPRSITTLSATLATPTDSRTSAAPLSDCDFSQLCSGENAYFWMSINVSSQEDGTTEQQVLDMVSGAFRCDEETSAASELCARNIQPQVSALNCNHTANISGTNCNVLLELSRLVSTCELRRLAASALQRAGSEGVRVRIVGEVERVGRSQCEGAASSSGRFVRCTSSSSLEEVCQANLNSSLSCSLFDPHSITESTTDTESCSSEAPQLCDCSAFCNSTNQLYATRLGISSAAVTLDLLQTLLSSRPCDTAAECQRYLSIYQFYQDVHLQCHGTEDRLYSCMVIMETSRAVDGCLLSELVQRLVDTQENITTELPLTQMVICGSSESTVGDLLASNLTWSASDQLVSDICLPEPTLFHCNANQSVAVLLSQNCSSFPETPSTTTPSTMSEPTTTGAPRSSTADDKTPGTTNTPEFQTYTTIITITSNITDSASATKTSTSSANTTTLNNAEATRTFTQTQNHTTTNLTTEDTMWPTVNIIDNATTEMNAASSATSTTTNSPATTTFATSSAPISTVWVTTEGPETTPMFATATAPYTTLAMSTEPISGPPASTTFATSTAATTSTTTADSTFDSATAADFTTPSTTFGFETFNIVATETTASYDDATNNATSYTSMMITDITNETPAITITETIYTYTTIEDTTQTTVSETETQTFFTFLDNTTDHTSILTTPSHTTSASVSTTVNNVALQTITLTPSNTTYNVTSFPTVTANLSSTTLTYNTATSSPVNTTLFNATATTNQTAVGSTTVANDNRSLLNRTSSNVTTSSPTTTQTPGFDSTTAFNNLTAVEATTSASVAAAMPNNQTLQNTTAFFNNMTTATQSNETVHTARTTDVPLTHSTAGVGHNTTTNINTNFATNVNTNITSNIKTTATSAPNLTVNTIRSTQNTTVDGSLAPNSTAASRTTADRVGPPVQATTAINSRSTAGSRTNVTTVSATQTQNQASAEQQVDELLSQTQDASRLNSSQIDMVVGQLEKILEAESISIESGQKAINVISNLMQADPAVLAPSANRIIKVVDKVGEKLSVEDSSELLSSELLVQLVMPVDGTNFQATSVDIISTSNVQTTALSRSLSKTSDPPAGSVFLPSSLTDGLSTEQQLQASRVQFTFYTNPILFQDQTLNNQTEVSPVLASSVSNLSISNLKEDIRFTIRHTEPQQANFEASCVFWDFSLHGGSGGWSSDGCSVLNSSAEETICGCSHLTSFAILLDLSRGGITDRLQSQILTFITYIGCGISAIFLAVTLLTYLSFDKLLRDIPAKILVQLCTALFFLNMVYLLDGWLALYTAPGLCTSTGFFLHYFLLSAFTWTGLEALHMYLSIVQVFTPYLSRYMLKFSLMGWGFPVVVVVIIIAVDKDNYGLVTYGRFNDGTTNDFCWLRNDIAFYVGVVAYFLLIFVLCVIVFIVVMVQLSRIKRQNPQNQSPNRGVMADVRSIAGLIVLLGLTWGFALFAWGPLYLPFVYLFSIFNSLQGFFIFIFHCAYKENVRRQWRTYLCCGRLRLAENSDWSRTATQNTRHLSSGTATTSLNHLTSRSSSVTSDSINSSGSVFVDSGISDTSHSDVVLNEIHRRNLTHQFQV